MRAKLKEALKKIGTFELEGFELATERPKLRELPEGSPELEEWREKLLDLVYAAHDIQEDESRPEELSFTEALMVATKELLTPVQLAGLFEALDAGQIGLTPDIVATYAMASETERRAARVRIGRQSMPNTAALLSKPEQYNRELLDLMVPESVEFIQLAGETEDDFLDRIIHLTRGLHRAWTERKIDVG